MALTDSYSINTSIANNWALTEKSFTELVKWIQLINERAVSSDTIKNTVKNLIESLPVIKTGSYTLTNTDSIILVNGSGANTQTLPSDSSISLGQEFEIQDYAINANTYNITIQCTSTQKIYGAGYSASGVSSITINTAGGMFRLRKVATDRMLIVRKI